MIIKDVDRDELHQHLLSKNIPCAVYYPVPMHLQECFASLGYKRGDFPESEKAAEEVMAIPIYPELSEEMQDCVVKHILSFLE